MSLVCDGHLEGFFSGLAIKINHKMDKSEIINLQKEINYESRMVSLHQIA
jgi:hypothetical protein